MNKKFKLILINVLLVLVILSGLYVWNTFRLKLRGPESVLYDTANKRYLVSNTRGGSIVAMDADGKLSPFIKKGLKSPKGMAMAGAYLYVADIGTLQVIDVANAKIAGSIPITGAVMLNDIAIDETGLLYITDTGADCLFIFDPTSKALEKISDPKLKSPNGLVYDRPRSQMLITSFSERAPIVAYDLRNKEVRVFMDTMYSNLDGIAIDNDGIIYFSAWTEKMIVKIPQEQNRFEAFQKKLESPADIYFNAVTNELIVPLLNKNKIKTYRL